MGDRRAYLVAFGVCVQVCMSEQKEIWRRKKNKSHRAKVKSASELTAQPPFDILWYYEIGGL